MKKETHTAKKIRKTKTKKKSFVCNKKNVDHQNILRKKKKSLLNDLKIGSTNDLINVQFNILPIIKKKIKNDEFKSDDLSNMKIFMMKIFSFIKQSIKADKFESFISSFALPKYAKFMTMNLTNRTFTHAFNVQFDYTNDFDFNPFFYIFIERYNFKKFYDIMIDIDASKYSIADYNQYLIFKKKRKNCIDESKIGAIHVQFKIKFITSISAVIIQTLIKKKNFM